MHILDFFQISHTFQLDYWQWSLAIMAPMILGISKAGVKGISIIFVTHDFIIDGYWRCIDFL